MSPKPYESLDVTAKSSTKGNCIILNIREGHSIGPYAYQLTSYRLTPDKAERLADMLDTALDEAENKEEKTQLKTSAVAICNLIIDFFDGEVQEMKAAKE